MSAPSPAGGSTRATRVWSGQAVFLAWATLVAGGMVVPFVVYPVFAMNVLVMALFASALNLLLGYAGLLSFGHAAFLGSSAYVTGWAAKAWGLPVLASLGLGVGLVEGFTKFLWPEAASVVVFVLMALVLLLRPAGLFGRQK